MDNTPGDLNSYMRLVQRILPIALTRPFVEQFVPEGTKVNWHCYRRIIDIRGCMVKSPCLEGDNFNALRQIDTHNTQV